MHLILSLFSPHNLKIYNIYTSPNTLQWVGKQEKKVKNNLLLVYKQY